MELTKIKDLIMKAETVKEEKGSDFQFNLSQLKQEVSAYERSRGMKREVCQLGVEYFERVVQNSL